MSRMTNDQITAIKQNVSLLNWIENEGHEPKKEGNDYVMSCIFHNDKTPSLKITPRKTSIIVLAAVPRDQSSIG